MSKEICDLLAKKFIARTDVKAIQHPNGSWSPHTDTGKRDGNRIGWRRADLEAHLSGAQTFGHYLLNRESQCKLFSFDIDLKKAGSLPTLPLPPCDEAEDPFGEAWENFEECPDLRGAWQDRSHVARWYMKLQFKELAHKLANSITKDLEVPCAVAYSGSKGVHVYAFTGLISGTEARLGAEIVLDSIGNIIPTRGSHIFEHTFYPNLTIEVYPKQDGLEGKDLGNLMRLPLGKNHKNPKDPTFFIDMTSPLGEIRPVDPVIALTKANPWE